MADRVEEFGELFAQFVRNALAAKSRDEPAFRILVRNHLGAEPGELPVLAEEVAEGDHANHDTAAACTESGPNGTVKRTA